MASGSSHSISVRVVYPDRACSMSVSRDMTTAAFVALLLDGEGEGQVLVGYPPAPLSAEDQSAVFTRIRHNETIRVRIISPPSATGGKSNNKRGRDAVDRSIAKAVKAKAAAEKEKEKCSPSTSSSDAQAVERSVARACGERPRQKRRLRGPSTGTGSKEAVSEVLVGAVAGGAKDAVSRALRRTYRSAVDKQYSSVKAVSRHNALRAGYQLTPLADGQVRVQYANADSRRAKPFEDVFVPYNELTLAAVLRVVLADSEGNGAENLKPVNLAVASPRVFWSIVALLGPDMEAALKRLLPGVTDWRFLHERKRELSAKSRQNLEQMRAEVARRVVGPAIVTAAAAAASVQDPPIVVAGLEGGRSRPTAAQTIVETITSASCEHLLPERWRREGLLGCALTAGAVSSVLDALVSEEQTKQLVRDCSARAGQPLSFGELDEWVAGAQELVLRLFWTSVCVDATVREALVAAGITGPKELLVWKSAAGSLLSLLRERVTHTDSSLPESLDEASVALMCEVAVELCKACGWLEVYEAVAGSADDEVEEEEFEEPSLAELAAEGWLIDVADDASIGKRVVVVPDEEDGELVEACIVAYLPATDEEPLALWKAELADGRRMDLDVHELREAERLAAMQGSK